MFQWGLGVKASYHIQVKSEIKIFGEGGGSVIFPCPGQIWNLKIFCKSLGLVIFLYPGQIWNVKLSVRMGQGILPCPDQIWNLKFSVRVGVSHLSMSRPNLKFKISGEGVGVSHLSMSRPNLKFKIFSEGWGLGILPCPGQIWNLKVSVRVGGWASYHVQAKSEI